MIVSLYILASALGSASCCYVETLSGPVEGFISEIQGDPVKVFLSVPFAEPPLGDLRFRKPEPVKPWAKTRAVTRMPPACIQYTTYPYPWADRWPGKSEDCLYLNIYAPVHAGNGSGLAVMFWIHGGGFVFGSNRMELYDGRALAVSGDVIVVTANYRLGLFGYLTSNTEDAPGNLGLHDLVLALRWVNDNIRSFGGDPKRITLFGESAGSVSISLLCVSPTAAGLFSRAILESGTCLFLQSDQLEPNLALSQRVAEAVGCTPGTTSIQRDPESVVGCLRSKEASELIRALWSFNPKATSAFFPQYGDDLLPTNFLDEIRAGRFHNVPLLIGNVQDEGQFLITTQEPEVFGFFGHKNPAINKTRAEQMIRNLFPLSDDPGKYARYYLDDIPDDDYDGIRSQVYAAYGDSIVCVTAYFAESYAERGNDVYFYQFSHRPSNTVWAPDTGVAHTEEIQFAFGRPVKKPWLYEPAEVELSRKMMQVWTDFAKNGFPSDSFLWPKYSRKNPTFMHIDKEIRPLDLGIGPRIQSCSFMRDYFGF